MKSSDSIWAIIPTRGGSKGLPEKNIKPIAGNPMLYYMLAAALASKHLTRIILTTDSDEIGRVASGFPGVEVLRHDANLSESGRPSFGVFQNTLKELIGNERCHPKAVALMRVTTPLCLASDIDNCFELLLNNPNNASAVISVTKSDVHPKRCYFVDAEGVLVSREMTSETNYPMPRQEFEDVYIRNGAVYATFPEIVLSGSLWGERPIPYVMPKARSININDEIDFILAEELLKRQNSRG